MSHFWSFAFTLTIICSFGVVMVNARREIYLSPNGKELWDGTCGSSFALKLPSFSPAAVDRCSLGNPCRLPNFLISAGPCNLHFLTGNYGGARVDYHGDLVDAPVPEVNITFGDVRNSGTVSGLVLNIHIMTDLEALGTPRMNIKSADPSSNVILTNGRMVVNDLVRFNAYVSGIDFVDFPITAVSDLVSTVYPGLLSFDKCSFQYTQAALLFYVRPPSRFFPSPELVHFEAQFTNSKISANHANSDSFIVGDNMTELGLSMKNSHFDGGVLILAEPGGFMKVLNFENSVISTSAESLFVPSARRGLFETLKVLGGTRLHSSGKAFNFFPPGYPADPGTGGKYAEQLVWHDVNLENVAIRASFHTSSISRPALKNVSCHDCSLYLNTAGEPYFEGHNRFVLESSTSSLRLNIGPYSSVFHIGEMTVYVKPELQVQRPFFLNPPSIGITIEGSLTTNMVTLAPVYIRFLSEVKLISEISSTDVSGKPATIVARENSSVTLGSINAFDVSLELSWASVVNYLVTDPMHGIQLSPDLISHGVSVHLPDHVNIIWSPEIPPPQLNVWYPLISFIAWKPQQITLDQQGPLKGLHAELALQPFKSGRQAVFRFYK